MVYQSNIIMNSGRLLFVCVTSPKLSQTSNGYCLCVSSFQHYHKQWEVTVCVCYQSKIITNIEGLLFMCFSIPNAFGLITHKTVTSHCLWTDKAHTQ
jgi:hypothetical protein